jgi:hypothetical protein
VGAFSKSYAWVAGVARTRVSGFDGLFDQISSLDFSLKRLAAAAIWATHVIRMLG